MTAITRLKLFGCAARFVHGIPVKNIPFQYGRQTVLRPMIL